MAQELWDDDAWFELASNQAEIARSTGVLVMLPHALDYLAGFYVQAGELGQVAELMAEVIGAARRHEGVVAALRAAARGAPTGREAVTRDCSADSSRGPRRASRAPRSPRPTTRLALLYNGLGQYERAFEPAERAADANEMIVSSWALPELVEAAVRSGQPEVARVAAARLAERTSASGTDWALGIEARARALVADDSAAEELYREAIERLGQSRMATHLARAQLSYGEWLRREHRRVDARAELRDGPRDVLRDGRRRLRRARAARAARHR